MRYYKIAHRPKTQICAERRAIAANPAKRRMFTDVWAILPKPSHILLVRPIIMRLFVILVSGSAQAQFPYNNAPYTPR